MLSSLPALKSSGYTRGLPPPCGRSRQHRCVLAHLLAPNVPPAWGEPRPPRLSAGGGNGKRASQFAAAAGCLFTHVHPIRERLLALFGRLALFAKINCIALMIMSVIKKESRMPTFSITICAT